MKNKCERCGNESEGNFCPECGGMLIPIIEDYTAQRNNVSTSLQEKLNGHQKSTKSRENGTLKGCLVAIIIAISIIVLLFIILIIANVAGSSQEGMTNIPTSSIEEDLTKGQFYALAYNEKKPMMYNYDLFERYPNKMRGTKVNLGNVEVIQIIESTEETCEYIVRMLNEDWSSEERYTGKEIYVKSKALPRKLIENDIIDLMGEFQGITDELNKGDVKCFMPVIIADEKRTNLTFNEKELNEIARAIFGDNAGDIKHDGESETGHIGTFKNLAIADLQKIEMYADWNRGSDDQTHSVSQLDVVNNMGISNSILPSADFQGFYHFETVTGANRNEIVWGAFNEITYYDKELNDIWSQTVKGTGNTRGFVNYTKKYLFISIDNLFYIIDNKTGEYVIEPLNVGITGEIHVYNNEIYIVNHLEETVQTDAVIKLNLDGKVIWRMPLKEKAYLVQIANVEGNQVHLAIYDYNEYRYVKQLRELIILDRETGREIETLQVN